MPRGGKDVGSIELASLSLEHGYIFFVYCLFFAWVEIKVIATLSSGCVWGLWSVIYTCLPNAFGQTSDLHLSLSKVNIPIHFIEGINPKGIVVVDPI